MAALSDRGGLREGDKAPLWISYRMLTTWMCFFVLLTMQSFRLNMSVAIVCMINHTATNMERNGHDAVINISAGHDPLLANYFTGDDNSTAVMISSSSSSRDDPDSNGDKIPHSACDVEDSNSNHTDEKRVDGPFTWTKEEQGLILSAYYWGYVALMIPCGWLVNRFGNVNVIAIFGVLGALITLAIPTVAHLGVEAVVFLRVVIGFLSAVYIPGVQNILSKWIPPLELAGFASLANSGYAVGTLLTFASSGFLCRYGFADGWQSIFYTYGLFYLVVTIAWWLLVKESPANHPCISSIERRYLQLKVPTQTTKRQTKNIPWKDMLLSRPVHAAFSCAIAVDFYGTIGVFFLPTYFAEVMKFKITSNGILSALPNVFLLLVQITSGVMSDVLLKQTTLSKGAIRKLMVCSGQLICAATVFSVGFVDCNHSALAVILVVISMAPSGLICIGCSVNPIDIAPSFSGLIVSIGAFISNLLALTSALLTTAIIGQNSSRGSWQVVFSIVAAVVLATFIFYLCFASGEIQPWAAQDVKTDNLELTVPFPTDVHPKDGSDLDLSCATGQNTIVKNLNSNEEERKTIGLLQQTE